MVSMVANGESMSQCLCLMLIKINLKSPTGSGFWTDEFFVSVGDFEQIGENCLYKAASPPNYTPARTLYIMNKARKVCDKAKGDKRRMSLRYLSDM
jgi:hypothetical protein